MTARSDETWRLLFEHTAQAAALVDGRDDRFTLLEANTALGRLLGDLSRPPAGQAWSEIVPPTDLDGWHALFQEVRARGELPGQRRLRIGAPAARASRSLERTTLVDCQCLPLRGHAGTVERLLVLLDAVSERPPGGRARLAPELIELIPLALATTSGPHHTVTVANGRFARLVAQEPAALVGQPLARALAGETWSAFFNHLDRVYHTGTPVSLDDFTLPAPDTGAPAFWILVVMPLHEVEDTADGLLLMAVETTAQVRSRREVEELAAAARQRAGQLEAVIGSMVDGVFLLDETGLVVEANEAGLALLGLPPAAPSQRLGDFLAPLAPRRADGRSLEPGADLLAGVLAGRILPDEQLLLTGSDGHERVLSLSGAPVREGTGRITGAVVLVRDITAQKQADQEKDAFLSLISHEVKSPLTSIKGFAQLATRASEGESGDRIVRYLQVIEQQVARIERLVNELADVDRLQKGTLRQEPTEIDLAALARTVVEQQQVTIASHQLRLAIAGEPLPVRADPARIEQVLTNLIANAVKYSPNADQVTIALAREGTLVHLAVRDEGIGIPRAEQGRLFERFYRATNARGRGFGGIGLGLFIAHEIVIRSSGQIWVESEEGRGTTFHIMLPLLDARATDAGETPAARP